ncbi:MAG: rod shape-determining protein RodA [Candidatus Alcyoniella australis]|nr:rod shape-determining protein RodA [Candidatus Alcyoniella australis]
MSRRRFSHADSRFTGRIDRRMLINFDWPMMIMVSLLLVAGIFNLMSVDESDGDLLVERQLMALAIGGILLVVAFSLNYRYFEVATPGIYVGMIGLLILVLAFGETRKGATRWIGYGSMTLQPSELMKIAVPLMLARWFTQNKRYRPYTFKELLAPMAIIALPMLLIMAQPDLGTAIIIGLVGTTVLLYARVHWKTLLGLGISALLVLPAIWLWVLKDYQKLRITTLINPQSDPQGAGYHIQQSLIAIGSGRWLGKGYMHGTQSRLRFLPEHHTDFVFSVIAEEWGFAGSIFVLLLFFLLIAWGLVVVWRSKDSYGRILAVGLTAGLFWHVFINIGMTLGVLPVVGVTLPFFSFGRTNLIVMMIAVGLLMNISTRRYIF